MPTARRACALLCRAQNVSPDTLLAAGIPRRHPPLGIILLDRGSSRPGPPDSSPSEHFLYSYLEGEISCRLTAALLVGRASWSSGGTWLLGVLPASPTERPAARCLRPGVRRRPRNSSGVSQGWLIGPVAGRAWGPLRGEGQSATPIVCHLYAIASSRRDWDCAKRDLRRIISADVTEVRGGGHVHSRTPTFPGVDVGRIACSVSSERTKRYVYTCASCKHVCPSSKPGQER